VAIKVDQGLVFCSDSRTNAGVDNVSTYSKMHTCVWPGERSFTLLSAGNLATTQMVVKKLKQDYNDGLTPNLLSVKNMREAADYVGMISAQVQQQQLARDTAGSVFEASFIVGGQIAGGEPEIYMIYPQGNYIHESPEHPFLQIGETKYGKPILDRVISNDTSLERAARCALVSMNSTSRSNVTVGPPIELQIYPVDQLDEGRRMKYTDDDEYAREVSEKWNEGLMLALGNLPRFPWEQAAEGNAESQVLPLRGAPPKS
jgi:putative proteasome-type protease